ncbi:MAG: RtcB family protein [Oscillospiraceae bacterium]|nr:RtcB family protein [Oscillospiraceae bacterium]
MFEVQGKYGSAKIFAEIAEECAVSQIIQLCNQPMSAGAKIRIMPDVHAGAGCTIGTTMTITDKAIPNLVGVDIGCGMETVRLRETHIELQKLDKLIYRTIPSGFSVREKIHRFAEHFEREQLYCTEHIHVRRMLESIGTLGGGNHFIEADQGDDGSIYLVIHSGSRHLGVEVARYYQEEAYRQLNSASRDEVQALIASLKAEGKQKQIEKALRKLNAEKRTDVPKQLAYTMGTLFTQYIHDMKLTQQFAMLNRQAMMDELIRGMGVHIAEQFTTIHNYIDTEHMILRKGAVSARLGEKLLIPMNMRDGSLICIGKGNDDWNQSALHGAGRLMSRSAAKASFTVSEFKKQMAGIYTTSVGSGTLDECPMAYKPMEAIVGCIGDTVEISEIIRPIYNFKAGEDDA